MISACKRTRPRFHQKRYLKTIKFSGQAKALEEGKLAGPMAWTVTDVPDVATGSSIPLRKIHFVTIPAGTAVTNRESWELVKD
jgi:hypothetical protein